jgi:hypothetical protein
MAKWTFDSTNIRSIEYIKDLKILIVEFVRDGARWEYIDLPPEVNQAFRDSPSPGKFYAAEIKGKFIGRRIDDPTED